MKRPTVVELSDGGKYWEHTYDKFYLKAYVPTTELDGQVNNYTFSAPLLLVFEENRQNINDAIAFAKTSGLADIAAENDASVLFVYPTNESGWEKATVDMYVDLIAEVKMDPEYADGIVALTDFFSNTFKGYFIKGAKFRTDIYSFGKSADYVARNLLKEIKGEFLWGPGEISPAMCSMEGLSVKPDLERNDIAVLSVGNSAEINEAFTSCKYLLVKDTADYKTDYISFVHKFKMWCNRMELEPDFKELDMTEEAGCVTVNTSADNRGKYKDSPNHKVGYFAYYNNGLLDNGPVPVFLGFHGGGDSAKFLTFVSEWYVVAHKYNFLYIAFENHLDVTATEVIEVLETLKKRYPIDEHRIYAGGFSMGSGKSWDLYQQYPKVFAGLAPASALFPVWNNPFSAFPEDKINMTEPVPVFYSGGECSPLVELPFQDNSALDRLKYVAQVNKLNERFNISLDDKDKWENPFWGIDGDAQEKIYDVSRDSYLTVNYYTSEDGICRTAFASVSGQQHECRLHSCENAWKFISKFTR